MHVTRLVSLALGAALLGGCSVWQNASRKYLDKSAYDLAGIKIRESLVGCAEPVDDPTWTEASTDERARVLTREFEGAFELRVQAHASDTACDYRFATEEERTEALPAARDHAIERP